MVLDVEGVRAVIRAQIAKSSARAVATEVGINHVSITAFAAGKVARPAGKNWKEIVQYAELHAADDMPARALDGPPSVQLKTLAEHVLWIGGKLDLISQQIIGGAQQQRVFVQQLGQLAENEQRGHDALDSANAMVEAAGAGRKRRKGRKGKRASA